MQFIIINLKTGYDIKEVYIHYEDPFINGILGGKEKWQSVIIMKFLE